MRPTLLARTDLDMVDVCTPQHFHHDLVIAAAAGGRHVLSEKPLATTPRDAWEMVAAAEAAGTTLAIMHNYLLFSEVARTLEIIGSGEIGPVEVVILNWLGVPDSPGNAAYRPTWRHDPTQAGGGVLMDMLHIVYLAEAMLGAPIERVSAWVTARKDGAPGRGHRARPLRDGRCRGPRQCRLGRRRGRVLRVGAGRAASTSRTATGATVAGSPSSGSSCTAGAAGRRSRTSRTSMAPIR